VTIEKNSTVCDQLRWRCVIAPG